MNSSSPRSDVTRILRRTLESRGCKVVPLDSWRPEPQTLHEIPPEISAAITGNIDVLKVEADSSLWRTEVRYHVRLTGYIGLREKKEILKRSIEVSPQESHLRFNLGTIEENLNAAVAKALDVFLEGILPSSR